MTSRLKWYYNRLATMNPAELLFRGKQIGQQVSEKLYTPVPEYDDATISRKNLPFDLTGFTTTEEFTIFGKPLAITGNPDFHKDIFSGKRFPLGFSKTIDIRSDRFGSAKVVWEINRLQFLVPLLIDYKTTADKSKLDQFIAIITAWDEQNPYMKGINWYSNIEVNIRLINWYWCWLILENDPVWEQEEQYASFRANTWLPLIYKHCHFSSRNPSYFSSANNHLVAEYAGLFIASTLWQFKETSKWLKKSRAGLEREILLQHSENGVNKEETAPYIQFITDFFLLAFLAGRHAGIRFSSEYEERLTAICSYIHHFLDMGNNTPGYGDDDSGRVILPDGDINTNNFVSILNTCAVLFDRPEWKRPGTWNLKAQLLTTGTGGKDKWDGMDSPDEQTGSVFYKNEGHFIIRKRSGGRETYCHFDAAPLGYLSIAAHGHADALSFVLHVNGYPFLTDPGTYAYHTHSNWRKYFTGTPAHNTVTIDQMDQATLAGPTLWLNHFTCKVLDASSDPEKDSITATHDGYATKGITHTRTIAFDKITDCIELSDLIEAANPGPGYQVNMPLHLHPDVSAVRVSANTYLLKHSRTSATVEVSYDPLLTVRKTDAEEGKTAGWYSPAFMKMVKASLLMGEYNAKETKLSLHTTIKIFNSYH